MGGDEDAPGGGNRWDKGLAGEAEADVFGNVSGVTALLSP